MADPGNLGRRVAQRRQELGLSIEELAERTNMAASYLRHVETTPTAHPDTRAVMTIATALDTRASYLLGAEAHHSLGHHPLDAPPTLSELTPPQCWKLLGPGGLGRVVFDSERGPTALPVAYRVVGPELIFGVSSGTHLDHLDGQEPVGLEADQFDEAIGEGWSVLASGPVRRADAERDLDARSGGDLDVWETGGHLLVLEPIELTGRRVVANPGI